MWSNLQLKVAFCLTFSCFPVGCDTAPPPTNVQAPIAFRDLENSIRYGDSLCSTQELLAKSGIKSDVSYSTGIPPLGSGESRDSDMVPLPQPNSEERETFVYCCIDLIDRFGIALEFDCKDRLVSICRMRSAVGSPHIEWGLFGQSITDSFAKHDTARIATDLQMDKYKRGNSSPGPVSRASTKSSFINEVERNVRFGDEMDTVLGILQNAGVHSEFSRHTMMTENELTEAIGDFSESEKIGAVYYGIEVGNDTGMSFGFNCEKRLVLYERRWDFASWMRGKSIADVDLSKGAEPMPKE